MATRVITALFDDYDAAAKAVDRLEAEGIPHGDISIVANDADDRHAGRLASAGDAATPSRASTDSEAGTGATLGTVLGGGAGLLAGLGLLAIPGVGPVVAAGWLVATVAGAGVGAAAGGLLGGLTGAGLSPQEAETYAEGVRRGGTLVTARVGDDQADRVMAILDRHGSIDLDERAQGWRTEGWTGGTVDGRPGAATGDVASTAGGGTLSTASAPDADIRDTAPSSPDGRSAGTPPAPSRTFGGDRR